MRRCLILIIFATCCAIATFLNPVQDNPVVSTETIPPLKIERSDLEERSELMRASRAASRAAAASASTTTTTLPTPPSTTSPTSRPPTTTVQKKATVSTTEKPRGDIWAALANCESSMNQRATSASGKYLGYFQFSMATWQSVGGPGDPRDHDYETQLKYAKILQARSGWGQWPSCSRKLGLR